MTAPFRLALDGGPPSLATMPVASPVAHWPAVAAADQRSDTEALIARLPGQRPAQAVRRLERRWGGATGRVHVVACRSTSAAARLAAASLELGPGDEVICPVDATGVATVLTMASGAVPVYVDLDPQTLHLDPAAVDSAVSDRTRAVLAVDRFGATADYHALEAVADRHDLMVLEDGSRSLGASYGRRPVGSLGSASFCGLSEAFGSPVVGAVYATDDAEQAANARRILLVNDDLGLSQATGEPDSGWGWCYRISELDAASTDALLARLDHEVAVRTINGRHLRSRLAQIAGIWMPEPGSGVAAVHSSFPLLVQPDELGLPETEATALRDTLIDATTAEGLFLDLARPRPMAAGAAGGLRLREPGPGRAAARLRADYPVADAMWASGLVLGRGQGLFNPPWTPVDMDRIADCFTKILVDNVERLRQLTLERTRMTRDGLLSRVGSPGCIRWAPLSFGPSAGRTPPSLPPTRSGAG